MKTKPKFNVLIHASVLIITIQLVKFVSLSVNSILMLFIDKKINLQAFNLSINMLIVSFINKISLAFFLKLYTQ